jgi:hypothetical protein
MVQKIKVKNCFAIFHKEMQSNSEVKTKTLIIDKSSQSQQTSDMSLKQEQKYLIKSRNVPIPVYNPIFPKLLSLKPTNNMPLKMILWNPSDEQLQKLRCQDKSFPKPSNWNELPLYEKSRIYGMQLGEKEGFYSDKLEIKDLVLSRYNLKTAPIVRVLRDYTDISEKDINPKHMLKSTHGSGWNIDFGSEKKLQTIKTKLRMWNKYYNAETEPHYRYIKPRFIIEEKVKDKTHPSYLITYRFRCIRGVPIAIRVTVEHKLYDFFPDWTPMKSNPMPEIQKPSELDELLRIASEMSAEFEYVRIDLYVAKHGIYFSEYTFTPNAYQQIYYNEIEEHLGKLWF